MKGRVKILIAINGTCKHREGFKLPTKATEEDEGGSENQSGVLRKNWYGQRIEQNLYLRHKSSFRNTKSRPFSLKI